MYENQGKRSGAYSGGSFTTNAFKCFNWQRTMDNLFTLFIETEVTVCIQAILVKLSLMFTGITLSFSEIASTTNVKIT